MKSKLYLKTGIVVIVSILGFTCSSCSDLLQEQTFGYYNEKEFFTNNEQLSLAVNGVYEVLSNKMTYGHFMLVSDCDTDLSHIKGAGIGHAARDLGHYNVYAEHTWIQDAWELYYKGIDRANRILDNKDKVVTKDSLERKRFKNLIAEARFLRGLCYFDLVRMWGDVPLKITSSKPHDNFLIPRTDRELVYDQIILDMETSIPDLPWHNEMNPYLGRISKGAAMGLLARVYLFRAGYSLHQDGSMKRPANYMDYYEKVKEITASIIASNKHALNTSYEKVFRNVCEYIMEPKEVMFEVQFFNPTGKDEHTGKIGSYNSPEIDRNSSFGLGNSFIKTSGLFWKRFDTGDLRRPVAIADFKIDKTDKIIPIGYNENYRWAPGKWRRNWVKGAPKDLENTDVNFILLRYADVLLMYAEAVNEYDGTLDNLALECLNQVKRRAYGKDPKTPDPLIDLTSASFVGGQQAVRDYLFDERARELCFEGFRRSDLIRWNLIGTTISTFYTDFNKEISDGFVKTYSWVAGTRFQAGKHELYPIPAVEIRETRNVITQNPNY
ncbi:MAG: RagB/SusD family nutrient uptake outer membrane protein [Paludibacter sp.]|nr:RagB/SusD family nutrient uptake outer membrane protein [Paludibacter sp.]